jgi:hypothetical protein
MYSKKSVANLQALSSLLQEHITSLIDSIEDESERMRTEI